MSMVMGSHLNDKSDYPAKRVLLTAPEVKGCIVPRLARVIEIGRVIENVAETDTENATVTGSGTRTRIGIGVTETGNATGIGTATGIATDGTTRIGIARRARSESDRTRLWCLRWLRLQSPEVFRPGPTPLDTVRLLRLAMTRSGKGGVLPKTM